MSYNMKWEIINWLDIKGLDLTNRTAYHKLCNANRNNIRRDYAPR